MPPFPTRWISFLAAILSLLPSRSAHGRFLEFPPVRPHSVTSGRTQFLAQSAEVQQVFDILAALYGPHAESHGWTITFQFLEREREVNAWAQQTDSQLTIAVFGGLVERLTMDQVAFVLCHELGHFFGNAPYAIHTVNLPFPKSAEGQADYHAARSCIRRYLAHAPATPRPESGPFQTRECASKFGEDDEEFERCLRALDAANALKVLDSGHAAQISYETPDPTVVEKTIVGRILGSTVVDLYPSLQCRLDTCLAGYLQEPRPRCWYNPADRLEYEELFDPIAPLP